MKKVAWHLLFLSLGTLEFQCDSVPLSLCWTLVVGYSVASFRTNPLQTCSGLQAPLSLLSTSKMCQEWGEPRCHAGTLRSPCPVKLLHSFVMFPCSSLQKTQSIYISFYLKHINHWEKIPFPVIFQGAAAPWLLNRFMMARLEDTKFELR